MAYFMLSRRRLRDSVSPVRRSCLSSEGVSTPPPFGSADENSVILFGKTIWDFADFCCNKE